MSTDELREAILDLPLVTCYADEGRERTPEEMPLWASRRWRTVVACVPELRDGEWGWLTTMEEGEG